MALATLGNRLDINNILNRLTLRQSKIKTLESCLSAPRVDIKELADCFEITVELPGVSKDDLHVTVDGGVLVIDAEARSSTGTGPSGRLIQHERRDGKLVRRFALGNPALQISDIDMNFADGLLTLSVPRNQDRAA